MIKALSIIINELNSIPAKLSTAEIILELSTRLIHKLKHKKLNTIADQLTEFGVYHSKQTKL